MRGPRAAGWLLLCLSLALGLRAGWIPAKAALAQVLLADAWRRGEHATPWPWADAWPVARLSAPRQGAERFVLSDASGRTLAFAPGHLSGTAPPGGHGTTVIAGHRDTHFAFLRELAPGDPLGIVARDGTAHAYRVVETTVVHARDARVAVGGPVDVLALVTCWPFDALRPGGELRYVVLAEREPGGASALEPPHHQLAQAAR